MEKKTKVKLLKLLNEFETFSQKLLLLALLLIFIGFNVSRALLSTGMALVMVAGVLNLQSINFKSNVFYKVFLPLTVLFFSVALSFFWSENKNEWLNFTRVHLPFFILPLCFAALKPFSKKQFEIVAGFYVLVFSISAFMILVNYFCHFNAINESMLRGSSIPVPYSHIRYSLLLAMAFFASLWLSKNSQFFPKKFLFALALFFFLMIHVLSVRSAIFSLYTALFTFFLFQLRIWGLRKVLSVFVGVVITALVMYITLPSLQNKINYMCYDLKEYANNKSIDASDGMRIRSWKAGFQVAGQQPFYGAGYGDIYDEMSKWYEQRFPLLPAHQKKLPHNQFLWWWLSIGWLGLIVSMAGLVIPLIVLWSRSDWLLKIFYVVLFSSFLWEPTLEEQMGTGFCIVWLMLLIQLNRSDNHD